MKKGIIITALVLGIGIIGYVMYDYYQKQKKLIEDFTYKIISVNISAFTTTVVSGVIIIRFTSVADIQFTINKFYVDFYVDDKNVGYVVENESFIIPAQGTSDVPINFSIDSQAVFKNAIDILLQSASSRDAKFRLDGYVDVTTGFVSATVPVTYETTLGELMKPS